MNNSKCLAYLAIVVLIGAVASFYRISEGSIWNSDDALYSQVSRQVSEGQVWPLHFDTNEYRAKPPLMFWLTGLSVSLLGDQELSYRLPYALSFFLLLLLIFFFLKNLGYSAALVAVILVLGSPFLVSFTKRVMLDIPNTLFGFGLLYASLQMVRYPDRRMFLTVFVGTALTGWAVKDLAFLPFLAAAISHFVISRPRIILRRPVFLSLTGIILMIALMQLLVSGTPYQSAGATAVRSSVLVSDLPKSLYWDLIVQDSPLFLLFPVFLGYAIYLAVRRHRLSGNALLCLSGIFFQLGALLIAKTVLPHYLIPALVLSFVFIAAMIAEIPQKNVRNAFMILVLSLGLFQSASANRYLIQERPNSLYAAEATKDLATRGSALLPPENPLCVFNTSLVGFRFYADRPIRAFFTTEQAYSAHQRVKEYSGMVFKIDNSGFERFFVKECGRVAILPTRYADQLGLPSGMHLAQKGTLVLVQVK